MYRPSQLLALLEEGAQAALLDAEHDVRPRDGLRLNLRERRVVFDQWGPGDSVAEGTSGAHPSLDVEGKLGELPGLCGKNRTFN